MVKGPDGYKSPFLSICIKGFRGNTKRTPASFGSEDKSIACDFLDFEANGF